LILNRKKKQQRNLRKKAHLLLPQQINQPYTDLTTSNPPAQDIASQEPLPPLSPTFHLHKKQKGNITNKGQQIDQKSEGNMFIIIASLDFAFKYFIWKKKLNISYG
jgi:hypothetical protein